MGDPWLPINAAWWPQVAAAMVKPWPVEAIYQDLRWWADQVAMGRAKRPGRPTLRARWGVTDHAAKQAMKAEELWGSPLQNRQPTASESPASHQPTTSERAVKAREDKGSPPADHQPTTSESPADRPTRVITKQQNNKTTEEQRSIDPDLERLWIAYLDHASRVIGGRKQPLTAKRRRALKAAIKAHSVEELLGVWQWWEHSAHHRAEYLRAEGLHIKTLLKPELLEDYVRLSKRPDPPASQGRSGRGGRLTPMEALEESIRQRKAAESASAAASGGGDASTVLLFPDGGEVAVDDNWVEIPF